MKLERVLLLQLGIVLLTLFTFQSGISQVKTEKKVSFSGSIDHIPKEQKFIVVNEMPVYLSPNAKIASARGSVLKKSDLRQGLMVAVEGVRTPEGFVAEKITLLGTPKL